MYGMKFDLIAVDILFAACLTAPQISAQIIF